MDGSPASRAALEWAARRAQLQKLPLLLVHAVPNYLVSAESVEYQSYRASLLSMLDSEANSVHEFAPAVEVRSSLHFGVPAQVLAELSARSAMVVIGTDRAGDVHGGDSVRSIFNLPWSGDVPWQLSRRGRVP
ncbi:universal stress protein [Arthrobacter alpinus]|nr:universal stress protein [Arthrobacter alpinus]